jgi:hypothetical protein
MHKSVGRQQFERVYFKKKRVEQKLSSAGSLTRFLVQTLVDEVLLLLVVKRLYGPTNVLLCHQSPRVTITLYL